MTTDEKPTSRLLLFLSSAFGAAVLAVMLISAFSFMVYTASAMMLARGATEMLGDPLPKGYHPVNYRGKTVAEESAKHLVMAAGGQDGRRIDIYELSGKEFYKKYANVRWVYDVIFAVGAFMDENTPIYGADWIRFKASKPDCQLWGAEWDKDKTLLPLVTRFTFNEEKQSVRLLVHYGERASTKESGTIVSPMLEQDCQELARFVRPHADG